MRATMPSGGPRNIVKYCGVISGSPQYCYIMGHWQRGERCEDERSPIKLQASEESGAKTNTNSQKKTDRLKEKHGDFVEDGRDESF